MRAALGIGASVSDYGQHAVIAHVDTARFHDYTAYERFTPDGPIAVLPIGEGRSAIVWTLAPEAARRALALDDAAFLAELQAAFGLRLGRFTRVGRRQAYPLALTQAERLTAPRAVILGNAAQSLHPVAGQGFNLALRDVAMLAELLADAGGGDPGDRGAARALRRMAGAGPRGGHPLHRCAGARLRPAARAAPSRARRTASCCSTCCARSSTSSRGARWVSPAGSRAWCAACRSLERRA